MIFYLFSSIIKEENRWKYTVEVSGMKCPKCEARANEAIQEVFAGKKVKSSHETNETIIICKDELDESKIKETITKVGYEVGDIKKEQKKGLFGF